MSTKPTGKLAFAYETIARLEAECERLTRDAERYQRLFDCRSEEESRDENVGRQAPLLQDIVFSELASNYICKKDADATIDAAITKQKDAQ